MEGDAKRFADFYRVVFRLFLDKPQGIDTEHRALTGRIITSPLANGFRVVSKKDHTVDSDCAENACVDMG